MTGEEYKARLGVFKLCVKSTAYHGPRAGLSVALIRYALNPRRTDDEDDRFHSFTNTGFHIRYAVLALDCAGLELTEEDREFLGRVIAEDTL